MEKFNINFCCCNIKKVVLSLLCFFIFTSVHSQTKKVLFLGNSYTYVNNLPKMVADAATSVGDSLFFDSNTIGGYYLGDHFINTVSLNKIKIGNWDNVVLQDQSLSHATQAGFYQFSTPSYKLDSVIKNFNYCAKTLFFITWGRKNGDVFFDNNIGATSTRTYYQMDSTIQLNYMLEADSLRAEASPVGATWRYIRRFYPSIELFDTDGSHPSLAGTYAAACCFYSVLFRKNPTLLTYNPGLTATDVANIRNAAKITVYDNFLNWNIGKYDNLVNSTCNTSIKNSSKHSEIKIFPNPFTSEVNLQTNLPLINSTLTIFNSFGVVVKKVENISGQSFKLQRENLPEGIYYLLLTLDKNNSFVSKLAITNN